MNCSVWHLEQHVARLSLNSLQGVVDLSRPSEGLAQIQLDSQRLSDSCLLGVEIPASASQCSPSLAEFYARGHDLVFAYPDSPEWPIHVDAFWRVLPADGILAHTFAAIELVVSVRTQLLDSQPQLAIRTQTSSSEVFRLVEAVSARFDRCKDLAAAPRVLTRGKELGCLVMRLPDGRTSYLEMVHPADFQTTELRDDGGAGGIVGVRHRLFAEHLEKGVILRARVRGVFLPRENDLWMAAGVFNQFAGAEPPLGG